MTSLYWLRYLFLALLVFAVCCFIIADAVGRRRK